MDCAEKPTPTTQQTELLKNSPYADSHDESMTWSVQDIHSVQEAGTNI